MKRLLERYGLPDAAGSKFERLLAALVAEPDPPTTVREPAEAIDVHVADSIAALELPQLRQARALADMGSGAGFPGLVLAVALPHTRVDLIESSHRKCEVIERLAAAAEISNARAVPARVEEWARGEGREAYDLVTARALAPLAVLAEYGAPLLQAGGALVAWKGGRDADEEQAGEVAAREVGLDRGVVVPVTPYDGSRNRHLHLYLKVRPTPDRFPRRPGMAAKRPLG
ncbi:MAG: 16S rRNA (guanine(527)-N(7))-methyltransferase RsmG [Thermoleophilaceae bacterium]